MKIINRTLLSVALVVAIAFQSDTFAGMAEQSGFATVQQTEAVVQPPAETIVNSVVNTELEKLTAATTETKKIKDAAKLTIDKTRQQLANNEISSVEAAKIIGEQNYTIEQAKKRLAEIIKESVDKVEAAEVQESYISQLISGTQSVGERILAPFKAGYGYTERDKGIARAIIFELNKQLEEIGQKYTNKIKEAITDLEKMQATHQWNQIKQEIESEIYQQQLITGDVMSVNRKLFWGAVGIAGALVGGVLAQQYFFGTEPDETSLAEQGLAKVDGADKRLLVEQGLAKVDSAEQYQNLEEQPGKRSLTERALARIASTEQLLEDEEAPFGGIEKYGAEPVEKTIDKEEIASLAEQGLAIVDGAEQYQNLEEQPGKRSLTERALARIASTEQLLEDGEAPFGGIEEYGAESVEKIISKEEIASTATGATEPSMDVPQDGTVDVPPFDEYKMTEVVGEAGPSEESSVEQVLAEVTSTEQQQLPAEEQYSDVIEERVEEPGETVQTLESVIGAEQYGDLGEQPVEDIAPMDIDISETAAGTTEPLMDDDTIIVGEPEPSEESSMEQVLAEVASTEQQQLPGEEQYSDVIEERGEEPGETLQTLESVIGAEQYGDLAEEQPSEEIVPTDIDISETATGATGPLMDVSQDETTDVPLPIDMPLHDERAVTEIVEEPGLD